MSKRKRIGALAAAAAAVVLIAALLIIQSRDEAPANDQAEGVATSFLEAFGAFDVEQARTYLADDATIASMTEQDDLRLLISFLEATGYQQTLNSCEGSGPLGPRQRSLHVRFPRPQVRRDRTGSFRRQLLRSLRS